MISEKLATRSIGTLNALELYMMIENEAPKEKLTKDDMGKLKRAIELATVLHSKHTRKNRDSYKRTPYIEHPLRNTLRLMKWGVDDIDILVGSVLHDVVEDGSHEYCRLFLNKKIEDEILAREQLSRFINHEFGERVELIVADVTNEVNLESSANKNEDYVKHVKNSITNNPEAFLVKLSDFVDNGTGLWHGDDTDFVKKQSAKYYPMIDVFSDELKNLKSRNILPVSIRGFQDIVFKLEYTQKHFESLCWHSALVCV